MKRVKNQSSLETYENINIKDENKINWQVDKTYRKIREFMLRGVTV